MKRGLTDLVRDTVANLSPLAARGVVRMVDVTVRSDHVVVVAVAVDHDPPLSRHLSDQPGEIEPVAVVLAGRPLEQEHDSVRGTNAQGIVQGNLVVRACVHGDLVPERSGRLAIAPYD